MGKIDKNNNSRSISEFSIYKKSRAFEDIYKYGNNFNFNNDELNALPYKEAIKYDKRKYINISPS